MEIGKPSISQISSLITILMKDEGVNKNFELTDWDSVYNKVENITFEDKQNITGWIMFGYRMKLYKKLIQLGFKQK